MKTRLALVAVFALVAIASPALFACEQCLHKGQFDPVGNYLTENKCWSGYSKGYASCVPYSSGSGCTTSTDTVCSGGSGDGRTQNPTPIFDAPRGNDCVTDLAGRCSREALQVDTFLR